MRNSVMSTSIDGAAVSGVPVGPLDEDEAGMVAVRDTAAPVLYVTSASFTLAGDVCWTGPGGDTELPK